MHRLVTIIVTAFVLVGGAGSALRVLDQIGQLIGGWKKADSKAADVAVSAA